MTLKGAKIIKENMKKLSAKEEKVKGEKSKC